MEQKLAVIKKALEKGAKVSLYFFDSTSKEEAQTIAEEITDITGGGYCEEIGENYRWFKVEGEIEATIFFDKSKEDKIRELEKKLQELRA